MATETVNITTTLADDSVTNAKLAEMNARTIKLRATGTGLGNPIDGSPDQASEILDFATDPFVRTSALPSGGGDVVGPASSVDANIALFDGITGKLIQDAGINLSEIIEEDPGPGVGLIESGAGVSPIVLKNLKNGAGTKVTNNTGSVQVDIDFTAADRYYYSDGSALPVEGTITSAGRDLLDDANAAAQRTTLGLGTAATANTGDFDAAGAAAAAQAASQPLDSDLTAIAGLTPSNDDVIQRKAGAWTNRSLAQLLSDFLFTTIGLAYARLTNPSAVTFPRQNADNTVTSRTAAELLTDLAAAPLASPTFTGTPEAPTPASGTNTTQVATTAFVRERPMGMHVASMVTWTNMPAAVTFLGGLPAATLTRLMPLGSFTQVRFVLQTGTVAGAAGSKILLRYRSAFSVTASDYLLMGATEVECGIASTGTGVDSGWINLVAGAIGDVYVTVLGSGGDGGADPVIGLQTVFFR